MRIRIIDAFTDRPFAGNPAAVCLLDADTWPDEAWMQQVAAELHLSETAFAHPLPAGAQDDADWALRWFNTVVEERMCGHATLATVHALHTAGAIAGTVRFSTASGVLAGRAAGDGVITLDFPAAPVSPVPVASALSRALGTTPDETYSAGSLGDVVAVLPDEAAVRSLRPDMSALAEFTTVEGLRGITVTAAANDAADGYDFVSRFFSPASGLPEDPVTGSAHTALAALWSARLGRDELVGLQASARSGIVRTRVVGDRVLLTGHAVTTLEGTLSC